MKLKNFINDFILVVRHGRVTFDVSMGRWLVYWMLIVALTGNIRTHTLFWSFVDLMLILIYTACMMGMRVTIFGKTTIERFDEPELEKPSI